jgi:hypothetical protein
MISFFILPKGDSEKKNIGWLSGVWYIDSRIERVRYSRPPSQESYLNRFLSYLP